MSHIVKSLLDKYYGGGGGDGSKNEQGTEMWFNLRSRCLTASSVAAVLGDTYQPTVARQKLLHEKITGQKEHVPPFLQSIFDWGHRYEPDAIDEYCKRNNLKLDRQYANSSCDADIQWEKNDVYFFGLLPDEKRDWLAGSPDGVTRDGVLLEVKCPTKRKIIPQTIPKQYVSQVQVLMEIMNLQYCDFIQYKPGDEIFNEPCEYDCLRIERDRNWFEKNEKEMYDFWQQVLFYRTNASLYHLHLEESKKSVNAKKRVVTKKITDEKLELFDEQVYYIGENAKFVEGVDCGRGSIASRIPILAKQC